MIRKEGFNHVNVYDVHRKTRPQILCDLMLLLSRRISPSVSIYLSLITG